MKGIVFTEFLEMVEHQHGYGFVDSLLTESELPSGGTYTAVGTYDHSEMMTLVGNLSQRTQIPMSDLLRTYGRYMFGSLPEVTARSSTEPILLSACSTLVQHHIHVEVRKLYPDAELPHFAVEQPTENHLRMRYESERKLSDFAHGLIEGCLAYFGEEATIVKTNLTDDGTEVVFDIVKA